MWRRSGFRNEDRNMRSKANAMRTAEANMVLPVNLVLLADDATSSRFSPGRPLPQIKTSQESGFQRPEASSLFHKLSSLDRSAFGTDRGYPESTGLFDCLLARLRQPFFFDRRLRQPLLHCSGATLRKHLCNKVKKESFCMARHQQDRAGVSGLISHTPHARTRPSFFLPTR
jgi:hypothetical protein